MSDETAMRRYVRLLREYAQEHGELPHYADEPEHIAQAREAAHAEEFPERHPRPSE